MENIKYYQKINIPFFTELVDELKLKIDEKWQLTTVEDVWTGNMQFSELSPELYKKITEYFKDKNLTILSDNILLFARRIVDRSEIHVDLYNHENPFNASVVIPIQNCDDSFMYWFDGDYTLSLNESLTGMPYFNIDWASEKHLVEETRIQHPTVCRVNVPHGARSTSKNDLRVTATFRFVDNPSFEELADKLS